MNWLVEKEFHSRPIVAVEDHVYHISELLRESKKGSESLLASLTVVCLDRAGPDTDEAVEHWLSEFDTVQVAARVSSESIANDRLLNLPEAVFASQNEYCRQIAALLRAGGLLLQDIELETLEFVPRDKWWESTMLATTVRGIKGQPPPRCAFISNKRGYEATFGAELLAAGHDPRDVLNKYETERIVVPFLVKHLAEAFSLTLIWTQADLESSCRIGDDPVSRRELEAEIDLVLWPDKDGQSELGGRLLEPSKKSPLVFPVDSNEFKTWQALISARIDSNTGVEVQAVGARVAPAGALRPEITNAAARHIHSLRKRLKDPADIVTVQGEYRLRERLKVGVAAK
ncbi:MAG: hypothetical protein AAF456_20140 [Planctomycetota bacterium]